MNFSPTFPTPITNKFNCLVFSSKKFSCKVFNAFLTSLSLITAEMFLSDAPCAMALIFTLFFPKVLNILPLKPWWFFMFSPTKAIMQRFFSTIQGSILFCEISTSKALLIASSATSASEFRIPMQIECSDEACVIKITLIFSCDNTSKSLFEEPATPIIPGPSSVIKVMLSIWLIPFTGLLCAIS